MTLLGSKKTWSYSIALTAFFLISACSAPKIDSALFNTLDAVLQDSQKLWNQSGGSAQPIDISESVCPLVSLRNLNTMYDEVADNDIVGRTYVANGMGIHPNKSFQYYLKKKLDFITTGYLSIVLNENGYCNAQYRQMTF